MRNTIPSIQLGIAPLSWQHKITNHTLSETIDSISKANFDGCELSERFPQDPFLVKNSIKQYGIKIASSQFHAYFTDKNRYNDTINRFLDHMHFLNAIGAKRIVVYECANNTFEDTTKPMLSEQPTASPAQFKLLVEGLNKIGSLAHNAGMQVVYQPRIGTIIHSESDIAKLMEKTDEKMVSLVIDTGHFSVLDINTVTTLKTYLNRVHYIYLKDVDKRTLSKAKSEGYSYKAAKEAGLFTSLGKGSLNFSQLFTMLKTLDYHGWVIAYGSDSDMSQLSTSAKNSRKFMKLNLGI